MTEHLRRDSGRNGEGGGSNSAIGRWTMPDSGAVFTMDAALIQKLRSFVLEGFHILPKRGAEMGGILLGRVLSEAPLNVEITGFEPVPCEYRYGPSYILSDVDRTKLESLLAEWNSPDAAGITVVGFFRSCTGRDLGLDAADQQLMRKYFPEARHFVLSIRPLSIFECEAWFFSRINGVLPRVPAQPPEPFGQPMAKQDRSGERSARSAPAPVLEQEAAAPADVAAPSEVLPLTPEPAPAVENHRPVAQAFAAAAGAGLRSTPAEPVAIGDGNGLTTAHNRPSPEDLPGGDEAWRLVERRRMLREQRLDPNPPRVEPPPVPASPVETPAEPTWLLGEHAAEPHKHRLWQLIAALLVLLIGGGAGYQWWDAQQRARWTRFGLDAKPGSGGIEVSWDSKSPALQQASRGELEVVEPGTGTSEGPAQPRLVELDAKTLGQGHFTVPTASQDVLFRLQLFGTGVAGAVESVRVVSAGGQPVVKELAAKPAAASPAPRVQDSGAASLAAASLKPAAVERPAPAAPDAPRTAVAPAPAAPLQAAGPVGGAPAVSTVPPAIPASAIYEIQPTVPEGVRARIRQPITVTVQVSIDSQGRVITAAARGDGDGVYRYLAEKATLAAQSWKFRPARSAGGAAIASTQIVYFTFRG
ncbi:hypothetical protein [Paludibaculum fermentans]|uniref:hypothetical protein n=1 Tax=Paludibaculum fermentans TaxID=1473598 RepID=UPI003EBD7E3C